MYEDQGSLAARLDRATKEESVRSVEEVEGVEGWLRVLMTIGKM